MRQTTRLARKLPTIDIAIRLEATQAEYEKDSFGSDYDANANGDPDHTEFGTSDTVETVSGALETTVTETTNGSDSTVIKTETVAKEKTVETGDTAVTYPVGTVLDTDTSEKKAGDNTADATQGLVYTGSTPSDKSITLTGGSTAAVYALTLPVSQDNTTWIKVVQNVGKSQTISKVLHNNTELKSTTNAPEDVTKVTDTDEGYYSYNSTSGDLTLWVHHASEITIAYAGLFAGGKGTAESPYEIATAQQMRNINYMGTTNGYYYKLTADIDLGTDGWWSKVSESKDTIVGIPNLYNSTLDGNGHTVTFKKRVTYAYVFGMVTNSTIKNLTVNTTGAVLIRYAGGSDVAGETVNIENVTVTGTLDVTNNPIARNYGVFVNSDWAGTLNMKNCVSNVTMQGLEYNAVFVGYIYADKSADGVVDSAVSTLNFENCENKGTLVSERAAMFVGNANTPYSGIALNVKNCTNSGTIQATATQADQKGYIANFYRAVGNYTFTVNGENCPYAENAEDAFAVTEGIMENTGTVTQGPTKTGMTIKRTENADTFTITPATENLGGKTVDHYKVSVSIYTTLRAGGTNKAYATEEIQANAITGDSYTTQYAKWLSFVDKEWVEKEENTDAVLGTLGDNVTYTLDGTTYYMIKNTDTETLSGTPRTPYVVTVYAYDASGNVIASANLSK
jgi:hypothetical protein